MYIYIYIYIYICIYIYIHIHVDIQQVRLQRVREVREWCVSTIRSPQGGIQTWGSTMSSLEHPVQSRNQPKVESNPRGVYSNLSNPSYGKGVQSNLLSINRWNPIHNMARGSNPVAESRRGTGFRNYAQVRLLRVWVSEGLTQANS